MSDSLASNRQEAVPVRQTSNNKTYAGRSGAPTADSPDLGTDEDDSPKRSIGRLIPGERTPSESSTANRAHHSASPSLSNKRPYSVGAVPHDGNPEAPTSGTAAWKDHLRESIEAPSKGRRQTLPGRRKRSDNALGRSIVRAAADSGAGNASPGGSDAFPADSGDEMGASGHGPSQSDSRRNDSRSATQSSPRPDKLRAKRPRESTGGLNYDQRPAGGVPAVAGEEQLINEVRGIYAGLVMVEKKCIEIDKQQSESKSELSPMQWQALIALHRTLLHEHHDFFLASQHPSASPVLRRLSEKYSMPARMWRYGIHSFLELLRHRLPDSLEHMLTFIYLAYSMMTLLLESVPAFEETWIECLGDLARYRMAVEEADLRDREVWAGVARYWYNKAADKNPDVGRIQHHLAVLARPDMIQQLFYYTKSLVSVHSFPSAGESILLLFNPFLNGVKAYHQHPMVTTFVAAHGHLFTQGPTDQFLSLATEFLSHLEKYIGRVGAAFRLQGVYMASCNFAAMFDYGHANALLPPEFSQKPVEQWPRAEEVYLNASKSWNSTSDLERVKADCLAPKNSINTSPLIFYGSCLAGETFAVILEEIGDKNVYPSLHIALAFIWCLAQNNTSIKHIEAMMPWRKITTFLDTMLRDDTDIRALESDNFPTVEEGKQLPEDFLIRGQIWSQKYYPPHFFDHSPAEDEGRSIEVPSLNVSRMYRCLWLGVRIAKFNRWFTYDPASKRFSITPFASELEELSRQYNPFTRETPEAAIQESISSDVEMQNT